MGRALLYFQRVTAIFDPCWVEAGKLPMKNDLDLGRLLGQREAFNVVAARCSAADATLLRDMREQKVFEGRCADWGEFCEKYLHISKTNANRVIRLLEDHGPQYFEVAQLTRISPSTY